MRYFCLLLYHINFYFFEKLMNFGLFWRIHLLLLLLCRNWHSERMERILMRMWNYLLKIDVRQSKHQYETMYYSQKNPLLLSSFLPLKCCCSCHCDPFTSITFVKHSTSPPKDFWNSKCQKNIPFLGVSGSQKAAITKRSPPGWRIGINCYHGGKHILLLICAWKMLTSIYNKNKKQKTLVLKL